MNQLIARFEQDSVTKPFSSNHCWGLGGWLTDGCDDCNALFEDLRIAEKAAEIDWNRVALGSRPRNVVCEFSG